MVILICRDKESKGKDTELKYCRCQYLHTRKAKYWNSPKLLTMSIGWDEACKVKYRTDILQLSICRDEASRIKFRTGILQMSICRDEESKVNYTQLKQCRCQYGKQRNVYRIEMLQMPICRDKETKLEYTELKHWIWELAERKQAK